MITFVDVFLMTKQPWVSIERCNKQTFKLRSYDLTKSSLARLVCVLKELPGRFNIDNVGWTWTREEGQ